MKYKLYQPSALRDLMRRHQIQAKKGFGQNFLIDLHALQAIVDAACVGTTPQDCVMVEIGPGLGTLTQALAEEEFSRVIAVEKDASLLPALKEALEEYDNVTIMQGDALKFDFASMLQTLPQHVSVRLAANLPYYITTPLLLRLLEEHLAFDRLVIMVQKEVASRLVANPGTKEYGALSVAVQYYSSPQLVTTVVAGSFLPRPQVDSAVVSLIRRQGPFAHEKEAEAQFFKIVRFAFAQRRKTLMNALSSGFTHLDKATVTQFIEAAGIDPMRRGETLSIEEFSQLTRAFH